MKTSSENLRYLGPREIILTCKGMGSVNFDRTDSDFEFVFGKDKVCRVHSVVAEFVSPRVARVRKCDPLYSSYTFKNSEVFNAFESLVASVRSGEAFRVEQSKVAAFIQLAQELENSELLSSIVEMIITESLSLEEAIPLLQAGIDLGTAFSSRFGNLRDYIASRFHEIEQDILDDLDLETSQLLLSSPSLQIRDEDSLYDFVRSRSDRDLSFAGLFESVCFDYLSVDRLEDFAYFVSNNLLENINYGIWRQICRRLVLKATPKEKKNRRDYHKKVVTLPESGREFFPDERKKLDGVIAQLTRDYGGNVHELGVVNVTGTGSGLRNAVDFGGNDYYYSAGRDSWICYDFKGRRVTPTSYSVCWGGYHVDSWVIEVSNRGTEGSWTEIDRRKNNNGVNTNHSVVNFEISRVPSKSFRFFRLRLTGNNYYGHNYLRLSSMEIFGTLFGE